VGSVSCGGLTNEQKLKEGNLQIQKTKTKTNTKKCIPCYTTIHSIHLVIYEMHNMLEFAQLKIEIGQLKSHEKWLSGYTHHTCGRRPAV
jgi:hypothetical protein